MNEKNQPDLPDLERVTADFFNDMSAFTAAALRVQMMFVEQAAAMTEDLANVAARPSDEGDDKS